MQRKIWWIQLAGMGLATLVATTSATAGWNEFCARCKLDFHRNQAWPEPFSTADRDIVRQHWEITEASGWRLQNTLGNELFHIDTHTLNTAGERKVKWILTYAPVHRRQVFVLQADTEQHSTQRMTSVQQHLASIAADETPVFYTDRDAPGVPGQYLQAVDQLYWSTQPPPRLPAATGGGTGSSDGSSGGGS